jgi:hypothetical protein
MRKFILNNPPENYRLYFDSGTNLLRAFKRLFILRYIGLYGNRYPDAVIVKGNYNWNKYVENNFNVSQAKVSDRDYSVFVRREIEINENTFSPIAFKKFDCRPTSNWVEYVVIIYLKKRTLEFRLLVRSKGE